MVKEISDSGDYSRINELKEIEWNSNSTKQKNGKTISKGTFNKQLCNVNNDTDIEHDPTTPFAAPKEIQEAEFKDLLAKAKAGQKGYVYREHVNNKKGGDTYKKTKSAQNLFQKWNSVVEKYDKSPNEKYSMTFVRGKSAKTRDNNDKMEFVFSFTKDTNKTRYFKFEFNSS